MTAPLPAAASESIPRTTLTVAIIGNPNTGKSTLFNALSGMQSRVGNYPGVTVEKKLGRVRWGDCQVTLVDLPGTYSLSPRSPDEMVAVDVLLGRQRDVERPDVVICIVDAANLERNLYLFSQIQELSVPVVLVLNMVDVLRSRGITLDVAGLERKLGVPIICTEAHRRRGLEQLPAAALRAMDLARPTPPRIFPAEFYAEVVGLRELWDQAARPAPPQYLLERMLLDAGGQVEHEFQQSLNGSGAGADLAQYLCAARDRLRGCGVRVPAIEAKARYAWARQTLSDVLTRPPQSDALTFSDRLDRLLTHRGAGLFIFCGLMFLVFQFIYSWAAPLMGAIEGLQSWAAAPVLAWLPPGPLRSLLVDGAIAGVGAVLVFVPQIALLFFFIAVFEDCGYMARAAFLMDKLMSRVGLSGKSFVPLMSSFACAVPGIMATRVIENRRDRMVTILVSPLMSCSARLPVYLLLIAAFVPARTVAGFVSQQGLVLFAMMSLGAVIAVPVAWLLKKTFFRGDTPAFVMELPSYKWPSPRIVLLRVYDRSKAFVLRAGTLIFAATIVVWAAGYFPVGRQNLDQVTARLEALEGAPRDRVDESEIERLRSEQNRLASAAIAESYLGTAGRAIEPVVRPLGWDWRIGVGVLASFPAREVIIATLGTVYSLGGDVDVEEDASRERLASALQSSTWPDGRPVYNIPVAMSIMVFFALCAQCVSTLVVIRRETNSWVWPIFTFVYMTALAYAGAWITYRIGMLLV
jgi:ferrous iron transport protein B